MSFPNNILFDYENFCMNWQAISVPLPGGMEEYGIVPERAAFNIGELPFEMGAFMEPLSYVVHGIERAIHRARISNFVP